MPVQTTNMHLNKPVDSDNAETAMVTYIGGAFDTIDAHNHSGGTAGVQVPVGGLAAGAATGAALGADVVTLTGAQNLTNKIITSPVISAPIVTGSGTVEGPFDVTYAIPVIGLLDTTGAQATPNKFVRSLGGHLQAVNSAYAAVIFDIADNGDTILYGHLSATAGIPTVAPAGSLGSGGTVAINADSNDVRGEISFVPGTGPGAGGMITLTFHEAFGGSGPIVEITPVGANSGGVLWYLFARSTTGFTVSLVTAPTPSATYVFNYHAIG